MSARREWGGPTGRPRGRIVILGLASLVFVCPGATFRCNSTVAIQSQGDYDFKVKICDSLDLCPDADPLPGSYEWSGNVTGDGSCVTFEAPCECGTETVSVTYTPDDPNPRISEGGVA